MRTSPVLGVRLNLPVQQQREEDSNIPDEYWDWAENAESGLEHLFSSEITN